MPDILHRIGVEQASTEQVYDALTTLDGIRGWWAENTAGESLSNPMGDRVHGDPSTQVDIMHLIGDLRPGVGGREAPLRRC